MGNGGQFSSYLDSKHIEISPNQKTMDFQIKAAGAQAYSIGLTNQINPVYDEKHHSSENLIMS